MGNTGTTLFHKFDNNTKQQIINDCKTLLANEEIFELKMLEWFGLYKLYLDNTEHITFTKLSEVIEFVRLVTKRKFTINRHFDDRSHNMSIKFVYEPVEVEPATPVAKPMGLLVGFPSK